MNKRTYKPVIADVEFGRTPRITAEDVPAY